MKKNLIFTIFLMVLTAKSATAMHSKKPTLQDVDVQEEDRFSTPPRRQLQNPTLEELNRAVTQEKMSKRNAIRALSMHGLTDEFRGDAIRVANEKKSDLQANLSQVDPNNQKIKHKVEKSKYTKTLSTDEMEDLAEQLFN